MQESQVGSGDWNVVEIANDHGMRARLTDLGARLLELWTPDRDGRLDDVVLGFSTLEEYRSRRSLYVGCTIGRVAGRIRNARFTLDGIDRELTVNEPPNHLHGGSRGFDDRAWSIDEVSESAVSFGLVSEDHEEGYPGVLRVTVTYTLTDHDELVIEYMAEPERRTPVSLTHHSYWNLGGHRSFRDVLDHDLWVGASSWTPTDASLVPTGVIASVGGTALDFREPTRIGARIGPLMGTATRGYDHTLVLDPGTEPSSVPRPVARLHDRTSGRTMELLATERTLQVYSGQMLPRLIGKHGAPYGPFGGIALEPQGFPDAVNEPVFPSVIVEPGAPYRQRSIHRFGIA